MKTLSATATAAALASLAFAQPALAARSAEALPSPNAKTSVAIGRTSAPIGATQEMRGRNIVIPVIAVGLIIAAIAIAAGGGNDSPG